MNVKKKGYAGEPCGIQVRNKELTYEKVLVCRHACVVLMSDTSYKK